MPGVKAARTRFEHAHPILNVAGPVTTTSFAFVARYRLSVPFASVENHDDQTEA
jgi:hypothetical protein